MAYTPADAQNNMNMLIQGLQQKYNELDAFIKTPTLNPSQVAEINNLMVKLLIEIHHRKQIAAFDAASRTVIRPPTNAEVSDFQHTLTELGKSISSMATFQNILQFVENLMTENAQRFTQIIQTIA